MNPEIYWFADLSFDFPPQDLEFQLSTWFDLQGCNILNTNMKIFTVADWLNQVCMKNDTSSFQILFMLNKSQSENISKQKQNFYKTNAAWTSWKIHLGYKQRSTIGQNSARQINWMAILRAQSSFDWILD